MTQRHPPLISKEAWNGNVLLLAKRYSVPLTDIADEYETTVTVDRVRDLVIDVNINKGATVVITPIVSLNDDTVTAAASTTGVIADGGEQCRFVYSSISAQRAKVVITKTEAGDSTTTTVDISGSSK